MFHLRTKFHELGKSPVAANKPEVTKISAEHYGALILRSIKVVLNANSVLFEDTSQHIRESCSKSRHVVTTSQVCSSAMLLLALLTGVSSSGVTLITRVS
jgi:hypothetical protein